MQIQSPAFNNNQYLPAEYTRDGLNINPPLHISGVPPQAKSMVLIFVNPDGLSGILVHWLLFDIDPTIADIEKNSCPKGALEGSTSFGTNNYCGPGPTDENRRYIFKLYALDCKINLLPKASKEKVENAMKGCVLEQAQLFCLYKKINKILLIS